MFLMRYAEQQTDLKRRSPAIGPSRHTPHMCSLSSGSDENIVPFGTGIFERPTMACEIAGGKSAKLAGRSEERTLTSFEAQRLVGICVELLDLCAKVTGQLDPALGELIAYAHDEALLTGIYRAQAHDDSNYTDYARQ